MQEHSERVLQRSEWCHIFRSDGDRDATALRVMWLALNGFDARSDLV